MAVLGDVAILSGLLSARPTDNAAANKGRLYLATDTGLVYRDTGSTWERYAVLLVEDYMVPASSQHVEATVGALFDDLYSRYYVLATTAPVEVVDGAGDFVLSAAGDSVIVRR